MKRAFLIIDIIFILTLIGTWISMPEELGLNLTLTVLATVITGALLYPEKEYLYETMRSRFSKNFINTLISVTLVFFIISLLNYLFYKNNKVWDLTKQKRNSLSKQSQLILDSMEGKIKIKLFAKRDLWERYFSILKTYTNYNKNVLVDAIDLDLNPIVAKSQGITKDGQAVIEYGSRKVVSYINTELEITNALLRLSKNKKKIIYNITGHDEISLINKDNSGGSFLAGMITKSYYELKNLDLASTLSIPKDADAIMILGPQNGYLKKEITEIKRYLQGGGKLILALDPVLGEKDKFDNFRALLRSFGIMMKNDVIVDRLSTIKGTDASILLVDKFNEKSPVAREFKSRIIFPVTSSVLPIESGEFEVIPVAYSSPFPGSWAESDTFSLLKGKVVFSPEDMKGPVSMAVTSTSKTNALDSQTRIFVSGTSRFLLNGYQNQSPNFNLFLNAISWAIDEKALTSISRPALKQEKIYMSDKQIKLIWYMSILVIPILMMILSIITYRRRVSL